MATAREEITAHTVSPVQGRGPAFYASLQRPDCHGANGEEAKLHLISTLWDHLVAMESPLWKHRQSATGTSFPIQLTRGPLGRPRLLVGEYVGPSISFSEGGGRFWAALSGDASYIGIDVAGADEFPGEYPFHRVFHPEELEHALILADGDLGRASALLWSVKEAVVKALGCAFHLVDPRQITVYPAAGEGADGNDAYTFPVSLSGKALMRFPMAVDRTLLVRSFPQRQMWLSVALLDRSPTGHE
jgi:phosphopantetheinyl transferase (holo-ACP synthase)